MSLTRAQWIEMWESTKRIEILARELRKGLNIGHSNFILNEVDKIKEQIQSIIGQME